MAVEGQEEPFPARRLSGREGERFRMPARGDLSARTEGRRPKAPKGSAVRSQPGRRPVSQIPACGIESLQLQVAIAAPYAAVETDDQRPLFQQLGRTDDVAFGIFQRKAGCPIADLLRAIDGTGR